MSYTDKKAYYSNLKKSVRGLNSDIPETMSAFAALHRSGTAEGVLSKKHKELIALGIAIAVRCDGCMAYHIDDALRAGASPEEIDETIGVAIVMGGGPAMIYGAEAKDFLNQFLNAGD